MIKSLFGFYFWKRGFWFRVFRKWFLIEKYNDQPILFSERYGYVKAWYFLGLRIKYLN